MDLEIAFSGTRSGLPPTVVRICLFGCVWCVGQCGAGEAVEQGSTRLGNESELPKNSSLRLGMRKPCDQEARTSSWSVGCHLRAARPVDALAVCTMLEAVLPGMPPNHLNCDQRLARSRSSILKPGASATSGMSNSMYSALVFSRPSVGCVTLPEVLPEETVASGCWKPLNSRYS